MAGHERTRGITNRKEGLPPGAARRRDAQKVVPSDPLDGSLPGRHARPEPGIRIGGMYALHSPKPVLPSPGSILRCASAARRGRGLSLDAAFHSPAAKHYLAASPAAGSTFLAYIFETIPISPSARSASRSRPRPAFCSPGGADPYESPVAQLRSQDLPFALKPPLPSRTSRSFGILALRLLAREKAHHCGVPDLPSLPVTLQ